MEIQKILSNCSSQQGTFLKLRHGQPMSDMGRTRAVYHGLLLRPLQVAGNLLIICSIY